MSRARRGEDVALMAEVSLSHLNEALPPDLSFELSFNSNSKTISYQQAIENIITQARYCNNLGIKKLLIINTHGGNSPIMQIAAMEIREKMHMLCAYTSWLRFGIPDDLITTEDRAYDIHAGFIETSVMLHIAPNLVNMRKAKNFSNKQQKYSKEFKYLRAYGPHSFAWMMNDLNSDGACGNAANATAKAGEIIFTHSCNEIIELINDINKFDISF